ncbi:DUF3905 domain-containing protein [Bacillus sp. FJAT-47783]|uniref:DUF3905 domain-containing protein n=1 Tax=Bacillus sp. FJAT-47783 TaxID=2922712 RepID=UPI001FAC6BC6|nr:DUF3905 domain-containing protein [Bacillus sp. FJAT-47783]
MKKKEPFEHTLPHQINAPNWEGTGQSLQKTFTNEHGVIIGDSYYDSEQSPLNNWNDEVDPSIMSGSKWVHPTNDIGWNTPENREIVESQKTPQGAPFMHPTKDVGSGTD